MDEEDVAHIYTMEYYSVIKRNEIVLFVMRWMDLESVIQSEVSQREKNKYHMTSLIRGIYKHKMIQMNSFTKQTHRLRKQTYGCQRGNVVGRDKLGVWD